MLDSPSSTGVVVSSLTEARSGLAIYFTLLHFQAYSLSWQVCVPRNFSVARLLRLLTGILRLQF